MIRRWVWRPLVYLWASPTTAIGLLAVLLTLVSGGRVQVVRGVIETYGGFSAWFLKRLVPLENGASAMTLGHVVMGRDVACLDRTRDHEHVHVRQCERWGPFFVPAYLIASVVVFCKGGEAYFDNPFEREAFEATEPGYLDALKRRKIARDAQHSE